MKNNTLVSAFQNTVEKYPHKGCSFIYSPNEEEFLTYSELYDLALRGLGYLQDLGIKPGDEIVLQVENIRSFVVLFYAAMLGGFIPVPLAVGYTEEHLRKVFSVWQVLNNPYFVSSEGAYQRLEAFANETDRSTEFRNICERSLFIEDIDFSHEKGEWYFPDSEDICFIQFSSGSTGSPKGVTLTHNNLVKNIMGMTNRAVWCQDDTFVNWMPLTHDMGLIGNLLSSMFVGAALCVLPTELFIRRPLLWMEIASRYKATILMSPNFGYNYFLKFFKNQDVRWDLSSVRLIFNGAEPIQYELCGRFIHRLSAYGLGKEVMYPVYGMAEASVGVAFPEPGEVIRQVTVRREELVVGKEVIPVSEEAENTLSFVSVGRAIPFCEVTVRDGDGRVLEDKKIGHIYVKGENVAAGYYNNPEATAAVLRPDGWLDTGDLGFYFDGNLVISGRAKDIVFSAGQNYYAHDIEDAAVRGGVCELGNIAAAGTFCPKKQKEVVLVFYKYRKDNYALFQKKAKSVAEAISSVTGLTVDYILPIKGIPKTTSGKIQRFKLRRMFETGEFDQIIAELEQYRDQVDVSFIEGFFPEGKKQQSLLETIAAGVLEIEVVDPEKTFLQQGGDSIKAVMCMTRLQDAGFNLSKQDLLGNTTFSALENRLVPVSSEMGGEKQQSLPDVSDRLLPLSPIQEGMLFHYLSNPGSSVYVQQIIISLEGNIEVSVFEEACRKLVESRPGLRRVIVFEKQETPLQKVVDTMENRFYYEDLTSLGGPVYLAEYLEEWFKNDRALGFDLAQGPLIRFALFCVAPEQFVFVLSNHHIILDGWCYGNLLDDLKDIYNGYVNRQYKAVVKQDSPYSRYLSWLETRDQAAAGRFWEEYLAGYDKEARLPYFGTKSGRSFSPVEHTFWVSGDTVEKLTTLSYRLGVTMSTIFQAAWALLLQRYNNTDDVVFGAVFSGRSPEVPGIEDIMGPLVNTLPLRVISRPDETVEDLLSRMQENFIEAAEFEYLPLRDILKINSLGQSLFNTVMVFENIPLSRRHRKENSPFVIDRVQVREDSEYEMTAAVYPGDNYSVTLRYNRELFEYDIVSGIERHFSCLLEEIGSAPETLVSRIEMLGPEEIGELLFGFNPQNMPGCRDKTLYGIFEDQAAAYPDKEALVFDSVSLTYRELNGRAHSLACYLRDLGVGPGCFTGLLVHNSIEMIVGILGILKAGGAYVPVDPEFPEDRIRYVLEESGAGIVLTFPEYRHLTGAVDVTVVNLADQNLYAREEGDFGRTASPDDPAYLIFTSGSTGKPKGTITYHRNVLRIAKDTNYMDVTEDHRFFQGSNYIFDGSVFNIFGALLNGAALIVPKKECLKDLASIAEIISREKITHLFLSTAMFNSLVDMDIHCFKSVCHLIFGGEQASVPHTRTALNHFGPGILQNAYGPTETTVYCSMYDVDEIGPYDTRIPIGTPITDTGLYIFDRYNRIQPPGALGELMIAGGGIGGGYLNRPELTASKFTENPLVPGEIVYHSGDLVRMRSDGVIEHHARIDSQVQIRGIRVELGEIENVILRIQGILQVVVVVTGSKAPKIAAYYTTGGDISENLLPGETAKYLPAYMVPEYWIHMDELPLTPNGKIDRRALPDPLFGSAGSIGDFRQKIVHPRDEVEKALLEIWQTRLGCDDMGVEDDFYLLGGDSILSLQVAGLAQKQGFPVSVPDIEECRTVAALAARIKDKKQQSLPKNDDLSGPIPFTPFQKRFFDSGMPNPQVWNQMITLKINGQVNPEQVRRSWEQVLTAHKELNIQFIHENGEWSQRYGEHDPAISKMDEKSRSAPLVLLDEAKLRPGVFLRKTSTTMDEKSRSAPFFFYYIVPHEQETPLTSAEREVYTNREIEKLNYSLDLEKGELVKVALFDFQDQGPLEMTIIIHHLVVDGISWRILLEDFAAIYQAICSNQTPPVIHNTASLMSWTGQLHSYWENHAEKSKECCFPQDKNNTAGEALTNRFYLSPKHTAQLLGHTESSHIVTAAFAHGLKKLFPETDPVFDIESHGRGMLPGEPEISGTVGWFTRTFPAYLRPDGTLIIRNGESDPFKISGNDIVFNYLGRFDNLFPGNETFSIKEGSARLVTSPEAIRFYQLEINAMVLGNELAIECIYNHQKYTAKDIQQIGEILIQEIIGMLQHGITHPLAPNRYWYLKRTKDLDKWGPGFILRLPEDKQNQTLFERAINILVERHDTLRLKLEHRDGFWNERITPPGRDQYFTRVSDIELDTVIKNAQNEIGLGKKMAYFVFINTREGDTKLYCLFHHLAVDLYSLELLIEELFTLYCALESGEGIEKQQQSLLPTYRQWVNRSFNHAQSPRIAAEIPFWLNQSWDRVLPLPVDFPGGDNSIGLTCELSFTLSREYTDLLFSKTDLGIDGYDIFLYSLVETFSTWNRRRNLLIEVVNLGRESFEKGIDLSQTAGWFNDFPPVLLDLENTHDLKSSLAHIHDYNKAIAEKGKSFGLLKYLKEDKEIQRTFKNLPEPQIAINFVPPSLQNRAKLEKDGFAVESIHNLHGTERERVHLLGCRAEVVAGQFQCTWNYSSGIYKDERIEKLGIKQISVIRNVLESIIAIKEEIHAAAKV